VILSDVSIRKALADGRIVIDPANDGAIQPSSVDLRVDRYFRVFRNDTTPYIDPKQPQEDLTELVEVGDDGVFILHPGEFVLGSTLERVALADDLVARLEGKSSLGVQATLLSWQPSRVPSPACRRPSRWPWQRSGGFAWRRGSPACGVPAFLAPWSASLARHPAQSPVISLPL